MKQIFEIIPASNEKADPAFCREVTKSRRVRKRLCATGLYFQPSSILSQKTS